MTESTGRTDLGEAGPPPQLITHEGLTRPAPAVAVSADGEVETEAEIEYERLAYPGEVLHGSVTLAVLLPGDEKESYFGSKHIAIVQAHEDYVDIKSRILTTTSDMVVAEIDETLSVITEYLANPAPSPTSTDQSTTQTDQS